MAYGTVNADVIGTSVAGSNLGAGNASIMKNRIINGAMVINQRGYSASPANGDYTLDRWTAGVDQSGKFSVAQSSTAPVGFINSLLCTSTSAYTVGSNEAFQIRQNIEGLNCTDLAWGTANAKTVTLSFQVYSSLTGTFGGSIVNNAYDRSYPFSYSIPVANTWTTISVTIAGDTSGTWLTTNGTGIRVGFSLGAGSSKSGTAGSWAGAFYASATGATSVVGTSGATFYITGVQLEVGSSATGFEYRQYGQELALCQRYYEKSFNQGTAPVQNVGTTAGCLLYGLQAASTQYIGASTTYAVVKRVSPTITTYNPYAASAGWSAAGSGDYTATIYSGGTSSIGLRNDTNMGITASGFMLIQWTASAEL